MDVNSLGPEAGLVHGAGLATYEYHLSLRTNGERTEDSIHVKVFVFVRPRIARIYLEV